MPPPILDSLGTRDHFIYLSGFWMSTNLDDPEAVNFTRKPPTPHPVRTLICIFPHLLYPLFPFRFSSFVLRLSLPFRIM